MFRRATGLLARPIMSSARARTRPFSTDLPATEDDDSDSDFSGLGDRMEQMLKDFAPKTPLSFMQPRPPTPPSIPTKPTVNFDLPKASVFVSKEVDMIIIPATTGQMGVLPGHVGAFVELKPGVMSVHEGNDTTKYFVSGGFAFISANSLADVMAVEAVPLDHMDQSLVQKGLAEFTQKLTSASTKLEKAEAQIGVDVHTALNAALTGCSFL